MRTLFVFIMILCIAGISYTAGDVFKYDDKGKRDPFTPLAGSSVEGAEGLETIQSIDDVKLEGIIWAPTTGSIALLNGVALKEGDTVGIVHVAKIEKNRVAITINEIDYELYIAKEEEEYLNNMDKEEKEVVR